MSSACHMHMMTLASMNSALIHWLDGGVALQVLRLKVNAYPQRISNRQSAVRSTGGAGMERSFGASKHSGSSEMGSSWSCKDAALCANGLGLSDAGQRIAEPWYRRGDADTLTIVPVCR